MIARLGVKLMIIILFVCGASIAQNYYYTCSYADSVTPSRILFSKIDLDDKSVVCGNIIPIEGEISFEIPYKIIGNQQDFSVILTRWGMHGKNSNSAERNAVNYAILDSSCNLVNSGTIDDVFIHRPDAYGTRWDSSFVYEVGQGESEQSFKGRFSLDSNRRLRLGNRRAFRFNEADFIQIDRFRYYNLISPTNRQLYWEIIDSGLYLIKLDVMGHRLIDTILVDDAIKRLYLFGYNNTDSLIYVFYMNYTIMAYAHPQFRKTAIDPSYLKRFSLVDMALVDSIEISYPPIDSGYIMGITTSIDKVGPYFVYFNLVPEEPSYFSPAMLFIFDTRTNETTWLRVGWR